jgi:branched-chain amino acid transport system substrate-binding protein
MSMVTRRDILTATAASLAYPLVGRAQTRSVKIGFVSTLTGQNAIVGEHMLKGMKLYLATHSHALPAGVGVQLVTRDDGGPNPDKCKQLAQELIVRERISLLAGIVWSPNAAAIAPLATQASMPTVLLQAGASANVTLSPYFVRFSFGTWTAPYYLGLWASRRFKQMFIAVSDYAPGHDSEAAFERGFKTGSVDGQIVGRIRMPLNTADFVPFLQRVKDTKPNALFVFVPSGTLGGNVVKAFGDLQLAKAGIRLIGTGDITADEDLPSMGSTAVGITTMLHYSAAADRPANRAFISAWNAAYGQTPAPAASAVHAWDGMAAICRALREQNGRLTPDRTLEILRNYTADDSPRGPLTIDQRTRDVRQNEYLREVRLVAGKLANVEIDIAGKLVLDPWVEANRK